MFDVSHAKTVMTFFAHPDDETLTAGGTIVKLREAGVHVVVCIPATGLDSRSAGANQKITILKHQENCISAMKVLGVPRQDVVFGTFPDNKMDTVPLLSVIKWLEECIAKYQPDTLLTHHQRCTNIDHRICFEAATVATRPIRGQKINLICGETLSSTGYLRPTSFEPSLNVSLEREHIDKKIMALDMFEGEVEVAPHPRSGKIIEALAILRGSESNTLYAEAFALVRGIM